MPYKSCMVPKCTNTTFKTPEKCFVSCPKKKNERNMWCKAMRRSGKVAVTSTLFVCEDHFDMDQDMENYMRYKMVGGYLLLKKGVVPHKFACQKGEKPASNSTTRHEARQKKDLVKDLLQPEDVSNLPGQSSDAVSSQQPMEVEASVAVTGPSTSEADSASQQPMEVEASVAGPSTSHASVQTTICKRSVACNTEKKKFKSCGSSPIKIRNTVDRATSPVKFPGYTPMMLVLDPESEVSSSESDEEYVPSDSDYDDGGEVLMEQMKLQSRQCSEQHIKLDPLMYLGIPPKCFFLLRFLSDNTKCSTLNVMIVLKKIRLNDAFAVLAMDFGMSKSNISKIFRKSVPLLANVLQCFVKWPSNEDIIKKLPISFRSRYCNVQAVIDCFEVEIEKPSNAEHQSLTWSQYYTCNTLKYLVCMTPDGLVTFVSRGYGGRISDLLITEDSGFYDKLSDGMSVMADRGFKQIAAGLALKKCTLVRPPSVSEGVQSTHEDVIATRRIAAVRIHVERLIGRFRHFKMILPHACIDNHLISIFDYIVLIAAGIINVQSTLTRH